MGIGDINLSLERRELELFLAKPTPSLSKNGTIVSKLNEAYQKNMSVKLGRINEVSFALPLYRDINNKLKKNENIDIIKEGYLLKAVLGQEEEWFIINKIDKVMSEDKDEIIVEAFSLAYELKYRMLKSYIGESKNCTEVLTDCLKDTNWKIGSIDSRFNSIYRQFEIESKTVLDIVFEVESAFDALVVFDTANKTVNMYKKDEVGENKGLRIEYGQYLETMNSFVHYDDLVTRLKVYGREGVTINSVNPTGKSYIDDFSYYLYPFERDKSKNVISSSHFMSDDLSNALLDYNDKMKSYEPKESIAEYGTDETTIIITDHGLVNGDYIFNRTRNEAREITVLNKDKIQMTNFEKADVLDEVSGALWESNSYTLSKEVQNSSYKYKDVYVRISTDGKVTWNVAEENIDYIFDYDKGQITNLGERETYFKIDYTYYYNIINDQYQNDIIDRYTDGTFGKLLFLKQKRRRELTQLETDKFILETELQQILDSIAIEKENGNDTTQLEADADAKQAEIDSKNSDIAFKQGQLDDLDAQVKSLQRELDKYNVYDNVTNPNFTKEQLKELESYVKESEWSDENYFNDMDLYNKSLEKISELNTPPIDLTIGIINFLEIVEEQRNWDKLAIGDTITVLNQKLKTNVKAKLVQVNYNFEEGSIDLTISNVKNVESSKDKLIRSMYKSIRTTKELSNKKYDWDRVAKNFNEANDRLNTKPANPIVDSTTSLYHEENDDGTVDLTFKWDFDPNDSYDDQYNIDGFVVYVYSFGESTRHIFGSTVGQERIYSMPKDKKTITLNNMSANKYYTFGVQSYRSVDKDINRDGFLNSDIIQHTGHKNGQTTDSNKNPYLPRANVEFRGQVRGKILDDTEIGGTTAGKVVKSPVSVIVSDAFTSTHPNRADFIVPLNSTGGQSTNAQTTILDAINSLGVNGGTVILLDGTYLIDSMIRIPSNITLRGQGDSTVIKCSTLFDSMYWAIDYGYDIEPFPLIKAITSDPNADILNNYHNINNETKSNLGIMDLIIDGNQQAVLNADINVKPDVISFHNCDNSFVRNVRIIDRISKAVKITGINDLVTGEEAGLLSASSEYTLSKELSNNDYNYKDLYVQKSSDGTNWSNAVENTDFSFNYNLGILKNVTSSSLYFKIDYKYYKVCVNNSVSNIFVDNPEYGIWGGVIYCENQDKMMITENTLVGEYNVSGSSSSGYSAIHGIGLTDSKIMENTITNSFYGVHLIRIDGANSNAVTISKNVTIGSNHISKCGTALQLEQIEEVSVSNNIVRDNLEHGMWIQHSKDSSITGNNVTRNSKHGIVLTLFNYSTYTGHSENNIIANNFVSSNNQSDNFLGNIYIAGNNNSIQSNVCRVGDLTAKPVFGLRISSDGSYNVVMNNDLKNSGTTVSFDDMSSTTITTSKNSV